MTKLSQALGFSKLPPAYRSTVFHSVITFLGQSTMQVVDLVFCRNLGAEASATIGTSTAFFAWFLIVGIGLISALEYFIPNSLGEKKELQAQQYFLSGVYLSFLTAMVSSLFLIVLGNQGELLGINPDIRDAVSRFCTITAWGYLPVFLTPLLRIELQARGFPHDSTFAFLFGNLLNIFLNWAMVLGNAGFEPMGTDGSAWANLISRWGILAYLVFRTYRVHSNQHFSFLKCLRQTPISKLNATSLEVTRMGLPIALHMLFEMGAFIAVSTLSSRLSAVQSAAHTIAISIASFTFMIPLGIGSAAALTISRALGEQKLEEAHALAKTSLNLGVIFAVVSCISYFAAPSFWIELYTQDKEVIRVGVNIMLIAGAFQFGDAMQVILSGILRGWGETTVQAKMNGIGHWLIGLPIGIFFGFTLKLQVIGLWIGLCIGLFVVAGTLYLRWKKSLVPITN